MARFTCTHRVRWPEVDLAGVVYFVHFVSYFEMAEIEWVRSNGMEYGELLEKLGIFMPRVSIQCNYHAPARLDDLLSIEVGLSNMGNTSFTLAFDVYSEPPRVHLADGRFVIATVSRSLFKPIRVPDRLRSMLESLGEMGSGRKGDGTCAS